MRVLDGRASARRTEQPHRSSRGQLPIRGILRLVSEADRYGYEIVKLLAERSGGDYELKEATMYSSVRRLEVDGEIAWYWGDESQGGRRKYFRITEKGKATYDSNKSNWEYAKRVLDHLL